MVNVGTTSAGLTAAGGKIGEGSRNFQGALHLKFSNSNTSASVSKSLLIISSWVCRPNFQDWIGPEESGNSDIDVGAMFLVSPLDWAFRKAITPRRNEFGLPLILKPSMRAMRYSAEPPGAVGWIGRCAYRVLVLLPHNIIWHIRP